MVREIGIDTRLLDRLPTGTSLATWAGESDLTGGALMVTPICCEGLAERKWVRLRMTLCVGENRKEALETRWSSRVYADYSRDKPNVVNRKFAPVWPKGEVVIFSKLSEPCRRLRLCIEVMTCAAPGAELQQEPKADKSHNESAASVSSPAPTAPEQQHLSRELIDETCEGVVWLALGSLVAVGCSFSLPTEDFKKGGSATETRKGGGGQADAEGQYEGKADAGGAASTEETSGTTKAPDLEDEQEDGLLFVTPREGLKQKLPESVKRDAWYDQHCSVMLAYRPDRISSGPTRIVIRLHSIRLPHMAHEIPTTRIRFIAGPDARHDKRQLALSWTSGAPMLQAQARSRPDQPSAATLAFRSQCVACLEVAGRTAQEQEACLLAVRLETVNGKEEASALLTMADLLRISCGGTQSSETQHFTSVHHSPIRSSPKCDPGLGSAICRSRLVELELKGDSKKSFLGQGQAAALCMEVSLQGDWGGLKLDLLPQTCV